jgi:hypothetical protein
MRERRQHPPRPFHMVHFPTMRQQTPLAKVSNWMSWYFFEGKQQGKPLLWYYILIYKKEKTNILYREPKRAKPRKKKSAIQRDNVSKKLSFIWFHSMSLKKGLLKEAHFPVLEWWTASIEDEVISLLPHQPGWVDIDHEIAFPERRVYV